jgi:DNA-binding response OmpR family regulator
MNQGRNARILVVEDNEDNRHLLSIYLTREGYEVLEARDGEEARAVALAESPDLVVSDVQMPRMDGYTLCRQLKENPQTELIPVILITAVHTSLEDTLEGLHQGANDFISRPFRRSELLARVRTQVRIKELQDRLVQAERVATIARMTVTMAHEINNPLVGILGHVELLLQELGREPVVEEELRFSLARVQRDALQIRDVLNRLREISRPEVYEYAPGLEGISLDERDGEGKGGSGSP